MLFNNGRLSISVCENRIYCVFGHTAVITLQNKEDAPRIAQEIENYFREAEKVISTPNDYFSVCSFIAKTATLCGCLTDISLQEDAGVSVSSTERYSDSRSAIAAIGAVCLIYRRLSALRGFNFRLMFHKGLPYLTFSAKILGEGIESIKDIAEYPALVDLDSNGVTIYSRLMKLTPEDGEELYRFTLVLALQADDPSGILRAPEWKAKTRELLDELDLDIPGRF